jgi:hypothetical protein
MSFLKWPRISVIGPGRNGSILWLKTLFGADPKYLSAALMQSIGATPDVPALSVVKLDLAESGMLFSGCHLNARASSFHNNLLATSIGTIVLIPADETQLAGDRRRLMLQSLSVSLRKIPTVIMLHETTAATLRFENLQQECHAIDLLQPIILGDLRHPGDVRFSLDILLRAIEYGAGNRRSPLPASSK